MKNTKQWFEQAVPNPTTKNLNIQVGCHLEEIEEMMKMTRLGQKLFQNGVEEGESIGAEKAKLENAKNLLDILTVEVIAERIGLPLETVQKLKEESTDK